VAEDELAKILVEGDQNAIFSLSEGEDDLVSGSGLQFDHPSNIETRGACGEHGFAWGIFVGEEAGHASGWNKGQAGMGKTRSCFIIEPA
jgi:hypothetical protein